MRHAQLNRRQFLELILANNIPVNKEVDSFDVVSRADEAAYDVFWACEPQKGVWSLPIAVVVNNEKLHDTLALVNSSPQVPTPFTAFCRVVTQSQAATIEQDELPVRMEVVNGLVGLCMAEASIYAAESSVEVSPATCRRTLTFAFARALLHLPVDVLPTVVNSWLQTRQILGASSSALEDVVADITPVLNVAAQTLLGSPPNNSLSAMVSEVAECGEPSDVLWSELVGASVGAPSLQFFADSTREDRTHAFQSLVKSVYVVHRHRVSLEQAASCALAAARIAPGTYEHLGLISQYQDVRLPLWYGFLAALQRKGAGLRVNGGLGLRVLRDILEPENVYKAPRADIAIDELRIIARAGLERLSNRLGRANEITVELYPGLSSSFRFLSKHDRREPSNRVDDASRPGQTLPEKIEMVRSLLSDVSKELSVASKSLSKPPVRRRPKQSKLL